MTKCIYCPSVIDPAYGSMCEDCEEKYIDECEPGNRHLHTALVVIAALIVIGISGFYVGKNSVDPFKLIFEHHSCEFNEDKKAGI